MSIHQQQSQENTSKKTDKVSVDVSSARLSYRARRWQEQLDSEDAQPRDKRLAMLAFLRDRLPNGFVTKYCLSYIRRDMDQAGLHYSDEKGHAHFSGAAACGSVWSCPVCSERISSERRHELKVLLAQTKYRIAMVTFTFQHDREDDLGTTVNGLNKAIRAMKSHRAWRRWKTKWGLVGHVQALEPTYGRANGWHPHRHEMLVLDPIKFPALANNTRDRIVSEMQSELLAIYRAELAKVGLTCDDEHGVKITANRREYGDYIAKWGVTEELTRSQAKQASGGGRSVWELLADAVRGDAQSWALFLEYSKVFKGKKQLHWSKGLRALLALPEQEKSDEEIASEQDQGRVVAVFSRIAWRYLLAQDLLGPVLNYCERAKGDPDQVMNYLLRMGLRDGFAVSALETLVDLHPLQLKQMSEDPPPLPGGAYPERMVYEQEEVCTLEQG